MTRMGSILLNSPPQSPALVSQPLPSSYPASIISSAESSDMHIYRTASAPTPTRRIRFAPLPETSTSDSINTPTRTDSPQSVTTPSSLTPTASIISDSSKLKSRSGFLKIFKRSPLSSPTGLSSNPPFSADDITSRIFRRPRTPDIGHSLTRTSSAREPKRTSTALDLKSRSSINSLGTGGGRHPMPPNRSTNSTSFPPISLARATVPKKTGMRMLNGRVYGSKNNSNPFANVREEPKFVEWGYGGMGSVNGSGDSKYSVLANNTPAILSDAQSQKGAARAVVQRVEEDDGSGMSWVRKRREEKERLARETAAQGRRTSAEARRSGEITRSSLENPVSSSLDTDSRRTSTDGSSALDTDLSTLAASSAPTTPPSTTDALPVNLEEGQEHHILHAIRLSPKHTHHHHKWPGAQVHSPDNQNLVVGTTVGIFDPDKKNRSPTSESSSDTDDGIPKEDDDDEESDGGQTEDQRKTSLGAGVEKISRHIEAAHKDGG